MRSADSTAGHMLAVLTSIAVGFGFSIHRSANKATPSRVFGTPPATVGINGGTYFPTSTPVISEQIPARHGWERVENAGPFRADVNKPLEPGNRKEKRRLVGKVKDKLSFKKAGLFSKSHASQVTQQSLATASINGGTYFPPPTPAATAGINGGTYLPSSSPVAATSMSHPLTNLSSSTFVVETGPSTSRNIGQEMGPVDPSLGDCSSEPHYAHASQEESQTTAEGGNDTVTTPPRCSMIMRGLAKLNPKSWRKAPVALPPPTSSVSNSPPPPNNGPSMLCRGGRLTVAPEYQELVDMGVYKPEDAGVPTAGCLDDYTHVIPWGTSPYEIAFDHPDYGLVTLENARPLMQRIGDPFDAEPSDLDRTLNRLAQVADFSLRMLPWTRSGVDPELHAEGIGQFPMRADSQRSHIRGVITRELCCDTFQNDQEWRQYLVQMEEARSHLEMWRTMDWDDDTEVGVGSICYKCQRRWDTGVQLGCPDAACSPILKLVRFYCPKCDDQCPGSNGETPLCSDCVKECFRIREGPELGCGHELGLKKRPKPGRAYKTAAANTR